MLGEPVDSDGEITQLKSPASNISPWNVGSRYARSWRKIFLVLVCSLPKMGRKC